MRPETLKTLIDEYLKTNNPDGLSEHVVAILAQERELRAIVTDLMAEQEAEIRRKENFAKSMQHRWAEVQDKCPHWEHSFHADPAGGRDSYEECNLCRKQW